MKFSTLLFALFFGFNLSLQAQNPGDTLFVQSFHYGQTYGVNQWSPGIRDTLVQFPADSLQFSKILMFYNIRCKDAQVSPPVSGQTDIGCGEWDVSCNTYITDSTHIDSVLSYQSSHSISSFSGNTFYYTQQALYNYLRFIQKNVQVDSIQNDSSYLIGNYNTNQSIFPNNSKQIKSQHLIKYSELLQSSLDSGAIHALDIYIDSGIRNLDHVNVRMALTPDTNLNDISASNLNFTEVFFHSAQLSAGMNTVYFYQPFIWDGSSSILVEVSSKQSISTTNIMLHSDSTTSELSRISSDDAAVLFNGGNYVECNQYKGIPGSHARSMEAWIKSSVADKEILSWGKNSGGAKWVFRINGNGALRVEVNGGYTYGSTLINDGQWHHVACTFSGSSVSDIKLYVDGNLETNLTTSSRSINTDTTSGILVRVSRGVNNRYFDGIIDDVRLWDTLLSQQEIQQYRFQKITTSHPHYQNLRLYFPMDENQGSQVADHSAYQNNAHIVNTASWTNLPAHMLFKNWSIQNARPLINLHQGQFFVTTQNDTLLDSIVQQAHQVKKYSILQHPHTLLSDEIITLMDTMLWQNQYSYVLDGMSGVKIDSMANTIFDSIQITELKYYKRYPAKFEIMSFVTPYGINLDLGPDGRTYTFDMTDFSTLLRNQKRMTVERGGQWMEDMNIRFAFIYGTPPRDVIDIQQIWKVNSVPYTNIISDRRFEARSMPLSPLAKAFKIRSTITGHGQEGEFIPRTHTMNINGGAIDFSWQVWKKCGENPIYPQGGTWIYDRAGWCPGAPSMLKEMDITALAQGSSSVLIDYGLQTASGSSNYIVNNQLVSYGDTNFTLDASIIDIPAPSMRAEYLRTGKICQEPKTILQNTGKTTITTAKIEYWINNNSTKNTYLWQGNLAFEQKEEIILPTDSLLWSGINPGSNTFHVRIKEVNQSVDEYALNDQYNSPFELPDVLPSDFYIMLRTNAAANETSYTLLDGYGNVILQRNGSQANTFYRDTLHLGVGCYRLIVKDSDGDGLSFFANNDGNGYFQIRKLTGPVIKTLNPNFGSSLIYDFTVNYPLAYEDIHPNSELEVFPNPSHDVVHIHFGTEIAEQIQIVDMRGKILQINDLNNTNKQLKLSIRALPKGVYIIRIIFKNKIQYAKIVKE